MKSYKNIMLARPQLGVCFSLKPADRNREMELAHVTVSPVPMLKAMLKRNAQGNAKGNAQVNAKGTAKGNAQVNAQGNATDNAEGNDQVNAQGSAEKRYTRQC